MSADGAVLLHRVALEARAPISTSHGTHGSRPLYLLSIEGPGPGYAEVTGLPNPAPGDPDIDGVLAALTQYVLPLLAERSLRRGSVGTPGSVRPSFNTERSTAFACHAVEALLLDRWSRSTGSSLAELLTVPPTSAPLARSWFVDASADVQPRPGDRVRAKVDATNLVERAMALLDAFPQVEVALDANGCLSDLAEPALFELLAPLAGRERIVLEQPLAHQDLPGHAALRGQGHRVYLDESVASLAALRAIARYGAADGVVLKPARLGGAISTVQLLGECQGLGLPAAVGGMLEAELGRHLLRTLAGHPASTIAGDVGPSSDYLAHDPTAQDVVAACASAEVVARFPLALGDPGLANP